jgi:hypothetical protein
MYQRRPATLPTQFKDLRRDKAYDVTCNPVPELEWLVVGQGKAVAVPELLHSVWSCCWQANAQEVLCLKSDRSGMSLALCKRSTHYP